MLLDFITKIRSKDVEGCLSQHGSDGFEMSISIRRDGLSFFLNNRERDVSECVGEYYSTIDLFTLENIDTVLYSFVSENPIAKGFPISVVVHNNLFTFVPEEFYNEIRAKDYIEFVCGDTDAECDVAVNRVDNLYIVFLYPVGVISSFKRYFDADISVLHNAAVSVSCDINKGVEGLVMNVCLGNTNFEVTMLDKGQFLYYNTFEYSNGVDVLYYIMTILDNQGIKPDSINVNVDRAIDSDIDEILDMCLPNLTIRKR